MLDVNLLREKPEEVKKGIADKGADPKLVDDFLAIDKAWKEVLLEVENIRAQHKKLGKEDKEKGRALKEEVKQREAKLAELEEKRSAVLFRIPNVPDADVPVGKDESENVVMRKWGIPPAFDFTPKDHLAIGEALGIIDVQTAGKVSGSRFSYLKGAAALMEFAIIRYVFDVLTDSKIIGELAQKIEKKYSVTPFTPVVPPVMIRPEVFKRMARLDPGQEDERYYLPKDDLYLVGSAEHAMGPMHMDETLSEEKLPLRYAGFSTSFRREAGSYGKDVKGILRSHQFDKIEIEFFRVPEHSRKEQDFIVSIQEYFMQALKLPYQVVAICTGDMGSPDARQIDIETWMPGEGRYRETHTSDMMTDYQSRRLATRVKRKNGNTELVHMNDATVFAIGRILIAIIENYQQADGSVAVPKALQKYSGLKVIKKISPRAAYASGL